MTLMASQASLAASADAALKQAKSASDTARKLLSEQDKSEDGNNEVKKELQKLEVELAETKKGEFLFLNNLNSEGI